MIPTHNAINTVTAINPEINSLIYYCPFVYL
jgi:hypothetical protein